ncbi:hypothetical protein [Shewanella sp. KCT]|uniref:hypothetical protein n=1 Tax=Shewanella sp. KCT TaxID=2569535 RepID=UPI001182E409|nr:hypothetical protein [Shewanella sp. KCT]TVP14335.1 hypothetical protein AYI87_10895 [Shewanella sp. KCT]
MDESDRKFAEAVLNRLMKGSSVNGLRFFTPQLLLDGPDDIRQEAYINLSSEWDIFEEIPDELNLNFEELTQEQEEFKLHRLRGEEVDKIQILSPWPHLVVHFKSGKLLFMNGEDHDYEPWQAGLTNHGEDSDTWLVVACPGGGMAVWCPEGRIE